MLLPPCNDGSSSCFGKLYILLHILYTVTFGRFSDYYKKMANYDKIQGISIYFIFTAPGLCYNIEYVEYQS